MGLGCVPHLWTLSVERTTSSDLSAGRDVTASFQTASPGGPPLYASATGTVLPGETTTLTLQVEPSGRVEGTVVHEDGAPAIGAQVRIEASGGRTTAVATGIGGAFAAEGVPTGPISIRVNDAART
jgi:hypothetical protein